MIRIKLCVMNLIAGLTVYAPRSTFAIIVIMMTATVRTEGPIRAYLLLDDRKFEIFDILKQKCLV